MSRTGVADLEMLKSPKDQAERLRVGIRGGWLPVSEAVKWADDQIARTATPDPPLIEVALGANKSREQMVTLLSAVPGAADMIAVMRACLADLLRVIERNPALARDAAKWLELAAHEGNLPEAAFGWDSFTLADEFALADQGIGTAQQAEARLLAFLRKHTRE